MGKLAAQYEGGNFTFARNELEKTQLWAARKEALFAIMAQRAEGTEVWSTDVAVPLSRLAEIIGNHCPRLCGLCSLIRHFRKSASAVEEFC